MNVFQIAHHHHHVPVPVPVPAAAPIYIDHPPHNVEEDFNGYDYAHPHIQYRKDMEELKEWGIEPYEEPFEDVNQHLSPVNPTPATPVYPGPYGVPQYSSNPKPAAPYFPDKHPAAVSAHAQNLAYSGYIDELKSNRQRLPQVVPGSKIGLGPSIRPGPVATGSAPAPSVVQAPQNIVPSSVKPGMNPQNNPYTVFAQQQHQQQQPRPVQGQRVVQTVSKVIPNQVVRATYDDEFYGPIVGRLDEIFGQLRFLEENCKERLVCSMYKNPAIYSPHSNLVSNELSRYALCTAIIERFWNCGS